MGMNLVEYFRGKLRWQTKLAFMATFAIGMLVHIYKFTNTLLNHDSIYNFYSDQNVLGSGRWFLSIACGISSYFDLPWVIGLISMIWICLTAVVIVDIFQMSNPVLIVITGGLLVASPAITETMFFGFTADGYMLAMLFAALAVRLSGFDSKGIVRNGAAALLVCLSCGIYQAYVSFGLLLTLCYFTADVLENRRTTREYWAYIGKQVAIYAVGLIAYFIIWKICMAVQGVSANHYQGISDISGLNGFSLSPQWLVRAIKSCIASLALFYVEWDIFEHGITLYGALNIAFFIILLVGLAMAACRSGLFRRKMHLTLVIFSLLLCIPCAGIWYFVSDKVGYRPMMLQSLCVLYIFAAVIYERWCSMKMSNAAALLLAVMIFNNGLLANISYFYMHRCYEQSYASGLEMTMRIRDAETEFEKIALVGDRLNAVGQLGAKGESANAHMLVQMLEEDLLFNREHAMLFLQNIYDMDYEFAGQKECEELAMRDEIAAMECWPSAGSMKVVDGILIIKLGDMPEAEE